MSKHMTIENRQTISAGLKNGDNLSTIARQVGKCESTISREIRNHRIVWDKKPYGRTTNRCVNRRNCNLKHICNDSCTHRCASCNQFPSVAYFDADTAVRINELKSVLEPYIKSEVAKFITGKRSLDEFDAYVDELKGMGLEEYQQFCADYYANYLNTK